MWKNFVLLLWQQFSFCYQPVFMDFSNKNNIRTYVCLMFPLLMLSKYGIITAGYSDGYSCVLHMYICTYMWHIIQLNSSRLSFFFQWCLQELIEIETMKENYILHTINTNAVQSLRLRRSKDFAKIRIFYRFSYFFFLLLSLRVLRIICG